jgi:anti-anti-sigma factor
MTDVLTVTIKESERYAVIYTDGYINDLGGDTIVQACLDLITQGVRQFILNLDKSPSINSVGISFIIEAIEHIDAGGGSLACCCLTPVVAKTFYIMRLTGATTIYDTEVEAVEAMK